MSPPLIGIHSSGQEFVLLGAQKPHPPSWGGVDVKPDAPSRVLLATTLRWPLAARLAIAFDGLGCRVDAWCPPGNPIERTWAVGRVHRANRLFPEYSLRMAIEATQPDLVVPCDDESTRLLDRLNHASHSNGRKDHLHLVIQRSLGKPAACSLASRRSELMNLARDMGIRTPETRELASAAALDDWITERGLPTVLKTDGSWGGQGVTIVSTGEEAHAFFLAATHPSWWQSCIELVLRRNPSPLWRQLSGQRATVIAQQFIDGRAANRAVACWHGEELAGLSGMALETGTKTGPATVVEVIDNPEMAEVSRMLVHKLGVSGFNGLDFVVEKGTGAAYLIEMNPRATPLCHLDLGPGYHLAANLIRRLRNEGDVTPMGFPSHNIVAMFPGEWRRDHLSSYLQTAFHDVPWQEEELVEECVALPWEERGLVARARAWFNPGRRPSRPSFLPR